MKKRMLALSLAAAGLTALSAFASADPPTLLALTTQAYTGAKETSTTTGPNDPTLAAAPLATGTYGLAKTFSTDNGGRGIAAMHTNLGYKFSGTNLEGRGATKIDDNILMAAAPPNGFAREDLLAACASVDNAKIGSA